MKILQLIAAGLLLSTSLLSCKKDDAPAPYGNVVVEFANEVDGKPLTLGAMDYTNANGDQYGVDMLKYYISNFTLVKADGKEQNFGTHELIDAGLAKSLSFTLDSVLNGDYTSVKFLLGIDGDHNHSGNQEGDLDPSNGMFWTWSTGYTFFKQEGNFKAANGSVQPLVFHYSTDRAVTAITLPLTKLTVLGNSGKLRVVFNLNSAFSSPNKIDFNVDNNRMSGMHDGPWISAMQANFADAFSIHKAD